MFTFVFSNLFVGSFLNYFVMDKNDKEMQLGSHQHKKETAQGNSTFGSTCLFVTGFVTFTNFAFHYSYLSPVIPILRKMYNSTYQKRYGIPLAEETWTLYFTLTMSILIIGSILGGFTSKHLLLLFSRKRLLQLCQILNIISLTLMAFVGGFTGSWEVMIFARLICGYTLGIIYGLVSLIIAEMCARNKQAFWQSVSGAGLLVGFLLGVTFAHPKVFGTERLWPALNLVPTIPSLIYVIASFKIPETPFYLLRQGKMSESLETLKALRSGNKNDCVKELSEMRNEMEQSEVIGAKEMITTRKYRNQLIAVAAILSNNMLTGVSAVMLYADYILRNAGISPEISATATVGIFAIQLIAGLLGYLSSHQSLFINRFGAWKVSLGSNVFAILAHTLYTISQTTSHLAPNTMPVLAAVALGIFLVGWAGGTNLTTLVLFGQLTTEPARATAFAFGSVFMNFFSWLAGFVPPYLQIHLGAYAFTIWLGCAMFFVIFQIIFIPDPEGKTVEEIQSKFE